MNIEKPQIRSALRRKLGKKYYILKRYFKWYIGNTLWAKQQQASPLDVEVFSHRSLVLRPLKDVDMYLQHNKRKNLEIAIEKINGITLKPKECFSFWKCVGKPSKRKGYLEGLVLSQGKIDKGIGGGLCQLGNLIFWMVGHSELSVKERYRHGYDVFPDVNRKVPFGAGATLSYNYIDLQLFNPTDKTFRLHFWLDDKYLHGKITCDQSSASFQLVERNHLMRQQYWGGYSRHNQIFKVNTATKEETLLVENHALMMYEPLLPPV